MKTKRTPKFSQVLGGLSLITAIGASSTLLVSCADAIREVSAGLTITGSSSLKPTRTAWNKLSNLLFTRAFADLSSDDLKDSNASAIVLSDAWIRIKEIEFKSEESEDDTAESETEESEVKFEGPYIVDLLSASPSPIDTSTLSATAYRRIKFKLDHEGDLAESDPVELQDNSVFLAGTIAERNFSYTSTDGEKFEVSGPNGVTPDVDGLLMVIRFADTFSKIDMSSVADGTAISQDNRVAVSDPCPLIEDGLQDIYTCIRKGIEQSSEFGKDCEDHDLDDEEDESSDD